MYKRIGIFGGTFNPVHNTHLKMAEEFVNQCQLDFCYFIPAFISPFKTESEDNFIVEPKHRLKMLELAINDNRKFKIETCELDKKGISYSIDTIQFLRKKHSDSDLYLLIGQDQAEEFDKWKNYKKIAVLTRICVVYRKHLKNKDIEIFKNENIEYHEIQFKESELSSTIIREKIINKDDISDYVPYKVKDYIHQNNLYI